MWQDIVFMVGGFIFSFALIPTIKHGPPPQLSSSVLTIVVLIFFGTAQATLGLYLAAFSTALTTIAWLILAVQRIYKNLLK